MMHAVRMGDWIDPAYDDSSWESAASVSGTPLYRRPVPLTAWGEPKPYDTMIRQGDRYLGKLPYAAQVTALITVRAPAGCRIDIRTDRYVVPGGPGDDHHVYNGHRVGVYHSGGRTELRGY